MNNYYAKLNDSGLIETTTAEENNKELIANILDKGFLPCSIEALQEPNTLLSKHQKYKPHAYKLNGKLEIEYKISNNDPRLIESDINTLKAELTSTDYKVIKNHEYITAGLEAPYNITELHNERETIREQIRELEKLIS